MTSPFEDVVRAWLLEYDDRVPMERRDRREAFVVLLANLQDNGYSREELTTSRKEKIVRSCVNPYYSNKSKLKKWASMVVNDLEAAIIVYYKPVTIRKEGIITPEISEKFETMDKKALESRAFRTPDDKGECIDEPESTFINPTNNPKLAKKDSEELIETTDEMLEKMPGPEPVWDEAILIQLGLKSDE
jgi:hypothetical protein